MHVLSTFAARLAEMRRRMARNETAMTEPGSIEGKTGQLALTRTTLLQILEPTGSPRPITFVQTSPANSICPGPQQHYLCRATPRNMNNLDAVSNGQYLPIHQRLVNRYRVKSLFGMEEQLAQHSPQRPGAGVLGRKGPPLSAIGISSGCRVGHRPVSRTIRAALPI